jgi:glycosyltransferase involved in cell wall biosynthesis
VGSGQRAAGAFRSDFHNFPPDIVKITVTCGRKFHSDHLAAALLRAGALERVITANPPRHYRRHIFPANNIRFAPPVYLPALVAGRLSALRALESKLSWWASRRFDNWASRNIGNPDTVVSWAWSARETFRTAKARGVRCILEECGSANAHQEAILKEEYERLELAPRISVSTEVIENEQAECELADWVLCPSEYVADSYRIYGIPREKCLVIPYASNPTLFARPNLPPDGKFRILYVGSVGPRKGIVYLLKALQQLPRNSFECTVIGRVEKDFAPIFKRYGGLVTHIPAVAHEELAAYYQKASVFVLPTLDEGMAYVLMEALCSGTPVITTPNSGGDGVVKDGLNGYIVPIRNSESIAEKLTFFQSNPGLREEMASKARGSAGSWTWDDYVGKLLPGIAEPAETNHHGSYYGSP